MPTTPHAPFENAVASYDRATDRESVDAAERERKEMLDRFPIDQWPTMPLERYALGQKDSEQTFCRWMEFRAPHLVLLCQIRS